MGEQMTGNSRSAPGDYVAALGQAVYNFACLEAAVVRLGDALSPSFSKVRDTVTPVQLAGIFQTVSMTVPPETPGAASIAKFAERFGELAKERNMMLHAGPAEVAGPEPVLEYRGELGTRIWTRGRLNSISLDFEEAVASADTLHGAISARRGARA